MNSQAESKPTPPQIDFAAAFSHVWKMPGAKGFIFTGGLLYLLFFLIVPLFILSGYPISAARALHAGEPLPPAWKWSHAVDGLKLFVVTMAIGLPFMLLAALIFVPSILSLGPQATETEILQTTSGWVALTAVSQILGLLFTAIQPAILAILARTGRVGEAFKVSNYSALMKTFGFGYLLAPLAFFVSGILGGLGLLACLVGVLFTGFYAITIQTHIVYQLIDGMSSHPRTDVVWTEELPS